jgi:hypothetical protein
MRRHFKEMVLRSELMAITLRYGSFATYEGLDAGTHIARYSELPPFVKLHRILEGMMNEFNARRSSKKITMVLFETAVDHICRIARILSLNSGLCMPFLSCSAQHR